MRITVDDIKKFIDDFLDKDTKLPCKVSEMTEREYKIYDIAANNLGFLMFLSEHIRRMSEPENPFEKELQGDFPPILDTD